MEPEQRFAHELLPHLTLELGSFKPPVYSAHTSLTSLTCVDRELITCAHLLEGRAKEYIRLKCEGPSRNPQAQFFVLPISIFPTPLKDATVFRGLEASRGRAWGGGEKAEGSV